MIDIKVDKANMEIKVYKDKKLVKTEGMTNESFKEYMNELCQSEEMLNGLRKATKLFKPSFYGFKDVK